MTDMSMTPSTPTPLDFVNSAGDAVSDQAPPPAHMQQLDPRRPRRAAEPSAPSA